MDPVLEESWKKLSLAEQMTNIGNEVKRAFRFDEGNSKRKYFLERAIECTLLSIGDEKNRNVVKELEVSKEVLLDVLGDHKLDIDKEQINNYYYCFSLFIR